MPYPGSDTVRRVLTGRISRLRRMLAGSNTLRRPVDRIEGAILMALLAVFGVAVAVASIVGSHTYQSQHTAAPGLLTTATVPGIAGAAAGSRIPIWLNRLGQPAAPPSGQAVMMIYALVTAGAVTAIAGVALLAAYAVGRHALDRRRLAAWEIAWARTGPSWTARR